MWLLWLAALILTWLLPGLALARALSPESARHGHAVDHLARALGIGLASELPLATFVVVITGSGLTFTVVAAVAATLTFIALWAVRGRDVPWFPKRGRVSAGVVVVAAATLALMSPVHPVQSTNLFAPCIYESSQHFVDNGLRDTLSIYDPTLGRWVGHEFRGGMNSSVSRVGWIGGGLRRTWLGFGLLFMRCFWLMLWLRRGLRSASS